MITGIVIVLALFSLAVAYAAGFALGGRWYVSRMCDALRHSDLADEVKLAVIKVLLDDIRNLNGHGE